MSSVSGSLATKPVIVEKIFENVRSSTSEEEVWSLPIKVTPPDSPKMALFKQGLYDPGSKEICTKYVAMSDSDVLRHCYYSYPSVKNPGILEALLKPEPKKIYNYDGQELYLDLCKQMNVIPVRSFHRDLLKPVIDLKYYGVNPVGVRAMCLSLANNKYVRRLDLTSNQLTDDACYHLGQLLAESFALQELVLSGCRIQVEGIRRLVVLLSKRTLDLLDLSNNDIKDTGFQYLAYQMTKGAVIRRLNLSYNNLSGQSALELATALEYNNSVMHLDMSWNKIHSPRGSNCLLQILGDSKVLIKLNMSWNGLTTGAALTKLLGARTLQILDLSNNSLYFLEEFITRPVKFIQTRELMRELKSAGAPAEEGLIDEISKAFPGPKSDKGGTTINLSGVVEYIKRLWPDKKLPLTPPPEPTPEPVPPKTQKRKKK